MPKPKRDLPKNTTIRPSTKLLLFVRQEVERRGEALKEDWTQAELLDEFYAAWERERLNQSTPIRGNSAINSLTNGNDSEIISVRPNEKGSVEELIWILRSGHTESAEKIKRTIGSLFRKLEGTHDGELKPANEEVSR